MDTASAGRRAAGLQRDAGMLHRGAPDIPALLDPGQRTDVGGQRQIQGGVRPRDPFLQGPDVADHFGGVAHRLRHVQVRGEKFAGRDRRHDPPVQ